jgi:hypothetical protein
MRQEYRISPYFSKEQIKKIDALVYKLGCSRADVVKNATLFVLYFFDAEKAIDPKIIFKEKKKREKK